MPKGRADSYLQTVGLEKDDLTLLVAIAVSTVIGILVPSFGIIFEPHLLVLLGFLLFLNLIKMDPQELGLQFKKPIPIILFTAIKLFAIPLLLFGVTSIIYPSLAIPVLLLSGISTGLGAPFVINVFERSHQLPLVVGMIIASSVVVPFVLPSLVYFLVDVEKFHIPFLDMIILLAEALFLPLFAGWLVKSKVPKIAKKIESSSFLPSVILISFMNLGIYAKFSNYFISEYSFVTTMIIAAFVLFFVYGLIGYFTSYIIGKKDKSSRVAAFVIMSYVNNTLVVVFASQFFGTEVAALAAFYNLAYYGLMVPLKKLFFD
ncbi:bile acid:sodium symporter family protein [Candidatus Nitrosocosmicus sp. FF01]|uniref:bile acid:sodium symporter family protein n=1 Tax=Candidatus Nitrosocosmicus sp. FF01 TaxID=3397670 RepID=UPI0039EA8881